MLSAPTRLQGELETALHIATRKNNQVALMLLTDHFKADINIQNKVCAATVHLLVPPAPPPQLHLVVMLFIKCGWLMQALARV